MARLIDADALRERIRLEKWYKSITGQGEWMR